MIGEFERYGRLLPLLDAHRRSLGYLERWQRWAQLSGAPSTVADFCIAHERLLLMQIRTATHRAHAMLDDAIKDCCATIKADDKEQT